MGLGSGRFLVFPLTRFVNDVDMRRLDAAGERFFQGLGGYYLQGRVGGHGAGNEGGRPSRFVQR